MLWRLQPTSTGASVFTELGHFVLWTRDTQGALAIVQRHNRVEADREAVELRDAEEGQYAAP